MLRRAITLPTVYPRNKQFATIPIRRPSVTLFSGPPTVSWPVAGETICNWRLWGLFEGAWGSQGPVAKCYPVGSRTVETPVDLLAAVSGVPPQTWQKNNTRCFDRKQLIGFKTVPSTFGCQHTSGDSNTLDADGCMIRRSAMLHGLQWLRRT